MDDCIVVDCQAPVVHGVPLCHHDQDAEEDKAMRKFRAEEFLRKRAERNKHK